MKYNKLLISILNVTINNEVDVKLIKACFSSSSTLFY